MTIKKGYAIMTVSAAIFVLLDQWSKWLAYTYLQTPVHLMPGIDFTYRQNVGVAWSLYIPYFILLPLNFCILGLGIYLAFKYLDLRKLLAQISLSLVVGGAVGNILDRLIKGSVADFISVGFWPVFNLADSFLTIGIFIIVLFYGKIKKES
jgi:signal peptidase II